jgi:hypothetical protein
MNYSIKSDLSTRELGGELFIYCRKNSTIYSFNGTGVFIWNLLKNDVAIDEISSRLCKEYDVSPDEALEDVSNFLRNIENNGLIAFKKE